MKKYMGFSEELKKKMLEYSRREDDTDDTVGVDLRLMEDITWFLENVWHDVSEKPKYTEGDEFANLILVFGKTSLGYGCSVGNMVDDKTIYAPIAEKEYKWGMCPFTKWAYVSDFVLDKIK